MKSHAMPGHLLRRLHQVSTKVFTRHSRAAGQELTPVQFAAMDAITAHPGIDQAGIAALIAYDRATIGGVIDRLEHRGLVSRNVSRQDRRAREVWPTDRGTQVYEASLPVVEALQEDILAGLDPSERRLFLDLAAKTLRAPRAGADGG